MGASGPAGLDPAWIRHEDPELIALAKPAGLLSVPGRGPDKRDSLLLRATARWPDALLVHRLDQATSGLMLLARSLPVQRALGQAFAERRVDKRYLAIVHGLVPAPDTADGWSDIELPLLVDWPHRPRSKVDHRHGKPSHTRWRLLARDPARQASVLELQPVTGRSHQLRVHLLALGHPIVGDRLYRPDDPAPRLMLHATRLEFVHPGSGRPLSLHHPAPFALADLPPSVTVRP